MTPAVTYLRCSADANVSGDTWERQRQATKKYADANQIEIVAEFRDEGVTGKMEMENREGMSECIAYAQEHSIKLVLVEDQTRLARDLIVAEVCIREFQRLGVHVIAASGGVDLTEGDDSNPTAKLIRQILAAVSEFERCVITLKLRGARQRMKAKSGRCEGQKPFGFFPAERPILDSILRHRSEKWTTDEIAGMLNTDNLLTRSGKQWRGSTIRKILRNEAQRADNHNPTS